MYSFLETIIHSSKCVKSLHHKGYVLISHISPLIIPIPSEDRFIGGLLNILNRNKLTSCNPVETSNQNIKNDDILTKAWAYVLTTEMPQDEEWQNAWFHGKIEEIELTPDIINYQQIDDKYYGKTVYIVNPVFEMELTAEPAISVDPDTQVIIGVIPGE